MTLCTMNTLNHQSQSFESVTGSSHFLVTTNRNKTPLQTKLKSKLNNAFTKKMLYRRFPILAWLPKYNASFAVSDLVAGLTVGLTIIPQAIAYALIAGVPPQYGLYSSFVGCFIYIVLGSCKDAAVGPSATVSVLIKAAIGDKGPQHAVTLCFMTGVVHLVMGLFGLGFLIDFISGPVASGFTSALAFVVVTSQLKGFLGFSIPDGSVLGTWEYAFANITETSTWDLCLGLFCLVVLLLMRAMAHLTCTPCIKATLWLISIARNAILVVLCAAMGYYFCQKGTPPFVVTGNVPSGLASVQPPFTNFTNTVSDLGTSILVVPLLALLEDIAVCKAFADGKTVDATQELLALGVSNIGTSFLQGFSVTAALARSAVNHSSGVKTTLGGLYTGILVILALLFLTPYFYYIPKATLAAIIMAAAIFMVEVKVIKPMWRAKKTDLLPALVTFLGCLVLPIQYGVLLGIAVNLCYILYHAARPKISVEEAKSPEGASFLLITPDRCLIFPSVNYVKNLVNKYSLKQNMPVLIDCSHIYGADYTAATVIKSLTGDFLSRKQILLFYNLKPSVAMMVNELSPQGFVVFYNRDQLDSLLKMQN